MELPLEEPPQPRTVTPTTRQSIAARTPSRQRRRGISPSKINAANATAEPFPSLAFAVELLAAVVLMVRVLEAGELAASCNDAGFIEQAGGSLGVPVPRYFTVQLKATDPVKPPIEAIWIGAVAVPPTDATVSVVEVDDKAIEAPTPLRATVCVASRALSVIVRAPVRVPGAVGKNVTEIIQLAPVATLAPHVLVSAKSPDAAIEVMVSATVPELVNVSACGAPLAPTTCEEKSRLADESVTTGADITTMVTGADVTPA